MSSFFLMHFMNLFQMALFCLLLLAQRKLLVLFEFGLSGCNAPDFLPLYFQVMCSAALNMQNVNLHECLSITYVHSLFLCFTNSLFSP